MCPDRQILSLYIDDELPSPWKEKYEAHLAVCPGCKIRLEKYMKLRKVLRDDHVEITPDREFRVWNNVTGRTVNSADKSPDPGKIIALSGQNVRAMWNRSVSLPMPAAAAAAAVFIIVAMLAFRSVQSPGEQRFPDTGIVAGIGSDNFGLAQMTDMNDVLQYLSRQDTADFLILRLPETQSFYSAGEPSLIKAADYSRRNTSR